MLYCVVWSIVSKRRRRRSKREGKGEERARAHKRESKIIIHIWRDMCNVRNCRQQHCLVYWQIRCDCSSAVPSMRFKNKRDLVFFVVVVFAILLFCILYIYFLLCFVFFCSFFCAFSLSLILATEFNYAENICCVYILNF